MYVLSFTVCLLVHIHTNAECSHGNWASQLNRERNQMHAPKTKLPEISEINAAFTEDRDRSTRKAARGKHMKVSKPGRIITTFLTD